MIGNRTWTDNHTSLTCMIVEKMPQCQYWYKALYLDENARFNNEIIISSLAPLPTGRDVYTIYGWIIGKPVNDDRLAEVPVIWLNYYDDGDFWKTYEGADRPNVDYNVHKEEYETDLEEQPMNDDGDFSYGGEMVRDNTDEELDESKFDNDEDRIIGIWESDGKGKFYIHVEKVSDRVYSIRVDHNDPNDWWEFSATYNDNEDIYPMKGVNYAFGMEFEKEGYLYFVGDCLCWYEEREDGSMEGFPNSAVFTKIGD